MPFRIPLPPTTLTIALLAATGCGAVPADDPSSSALDFDLADWDTVAVLGQLDGEPWEAFGQISEIALSSDGKVALLDWIAPAVYVFGPEGTLLGGVSAVGEGPGEFSGPTYLTWADESTVTVWDVQLARLTEFSLTDSGLAFTRLRAMSDPGVSGLCALSDRVFALGPPGLGFIREVGPDGGFTPRHDAPDIGPDPRGNGSAARLHCDRDRNLVIVGFLAHPTVIAYESDGGQDAGPVWEVGLDGLAEEPFLDDEGNPQIVLANISAWGPDHLLVQYTEFTPLELRSQSDPEPPLESRVIELDSGREVARTDSLPWIERSVRGDVALLRQTEPFSRVVILQRAP